MVTTDKLQCQDCGRWFTPEELYPWTPPAGDTLILCGECVDDREMEL